MKEFFHKYGYSLVKMFLYQFAISLFGITLAMATISTKNNTLTIIVSICAVIFYLFLLYVMVWDIGARDKISVDVGKKEYKPMTGIVLGVLANVPNLIVALLFALEAILAALEAGFGAYIGAFTILYRTIFEGMYVGLIVGLDIAKFWWIYFLLPIPSVLTAGLAYLFGHKNLHLTSVVLYQDPKQKKK